VTNDDLLLSCIVHGMDVFSGLPYLKMQNRRYRKCSCIQKLYQTSGSAARHPSLYLALRARAWLRMSQSYDLSDVDTTLMSFAAATLLAVS